MVGKDAKNAIHMLEAFNMVAWPAAHTLPKAEITVKERPKFDDPFKNPTKKFESYRVTNANKSLDIPADE